MTQPAMDIDGFIVAVVEMVFGHPWITFPAIALAVYVVYRHNR